MNQKIRVLTETSVLTAIAIILELFGRFVPIILMPQGGVVSLVLLPVIIVSLRHGYLYGFISGFIVGLIVFLLDGFIIHLGSIFFDYMFAFSFAGFSAIFKKDALNDKVVKFVSAITLASLLRYLMHGFSGVLFFSQYAEGNNAFFYSFVLYNLPYNLVSYILMIAVGLAMYPFLKSISKE